MAMSSYLVCLFGWLVVFLRIGVKWFILIGQINENSDFYYTFGREFTSIITQYFN